MVNKEYRKGVQRSTRGARTGVGPHVVCRSAKKEQRTGRKVETIRILHSSSKTSGTGTFIAKKRPSLV